MPNPDETRAIGRLARLVAFDTQNPPGHEAGAADYVAAELAGLGCEIEMGSFAPGRPNVTGRLANGPGPVFAFNTHLDVVPAGEGWTADPFTLRADGGRLHGRGACDAKGPAAAMIEAIAVLAADRTRWRGTLLGVFVADEEAQSRGAKHYAAARPAIDFAVVGEPTSNVVATAHKGSYRPRILVRGKTAHSGMPHLGVNAILGAGRLMAMIEAFHAEDIGRRSHPLVGNASITVTRIEGGHADNVIPDRCELLIDRRLLPGETDASARAEIEALLARARAAGIEAEIAGTKETTGGATETPSDAPIARAALDAVRRHGAPSAPGHPGPIGFPAACDLVHFAGTGASGVVIGPGSLDVAHKPDEFVPREEFIAAARIYATIATSMLAS